MARYRHWHWAIVCEITGQNPAVVQCIAETEFNAIEIAKGLLHDRDKYFIHQVQECFESHYTNEAANAMSELTAAMERNVAMEKEKQDKNKS